RRVSRQTAGAPPAAVSDTAAPVLGRSRNLWKDWPRSDARGKSGRGLFLCFSAPPPPPPTFGPCRCYQPFSRRFDGGYLLRGHSGEGHRRSRGDGAARETRGRSPA
ncbi:unnamed protein product, partial [Ectocarpus sp. 8 AP-2014]